MNKTKLKKYAIGLIDFLIAFFIIGTLFIPAYIILISNMDDIKITSFGFFEGLSYLFLMGIYVHIYKIYLAIKQKKDSKTIYFIYAILISLLNTILVFASFVIVLLVKLPFVYVESAINSYLFLTLLFIVGFSIFIYISDDKPKKNEDKNYGTSEDE